MNASGSEPALCVDRRFAALAGGGLCVLPDYLVAEHFKSRRLVRDYERLPETSAAMVKLSSIHRMARRARPARRRK